MDEKIISQLNMMNPWLKNPMISFLANEDFVPRKQLDILLKPEWDQLVTVLIGPRQAGKTTLGKQVCQKLVEEKRFNQLIYLNCDSPLIRHWLQDIHVLQELIEEFNLEKFILFFDEAQRLENPGLFIKSLSDLKLPIKIIVSGSSQLEIRSKIQEHLTGRQFEATILPLSYAELGSTLSLAKELIYGCYPQIVTHQEKKLLLAQLYQNYVNRDIIEILRVGNPIVLEKMMTLIAHSSGQLLNFQTLATDCHVSTTMVRNYFSILEKTYVLQTIFPFTGNKRNEITSNPKCYYLDNGFRNQALGNFASLENRVDKGLLVESAVFQEIVKYKAQHFLDFKIYFWRTKGGAEVDFVIYKNPDDFFPVEVKYINFKSPSVSRSFRSFIEAYQPHQGIIVTQDFQAKILIGKTNVLFIPLRKLNKMFEHF